MTLSTLICYALTISVLHWTGEVSPQGILKLLGLWPIFIIDILKTILLVAILFAGPLFEQGIVDGGLKHWVRGTRFIESLSSWMGYRNYVVVSREPLGHCEPLLMSLRDPSVRS